MLRYGNYVINLACYFPTGFSHHVRLPVLRARSSRRRLSSKRYYKLPVVIIMLIRVKHMPVVIYNINAIQIKLISCADISEI